MSTLNEENLVSVNDINESIEKFIGKHPENVVSWIDGKTAIVQLSNIGIRDKLFSRLAYLVENTSIEDNLKVFDMPAKCVYVSNQTIRFACTLNELVTYVELSNSKPPLNVKPGPMFNPFEMTPIKKFLNRLTTSNAFNRAQTIVKKLSDSDDSSKITVYIIGNPETHSYDAKTNNYSPYVTWKVLDIIKIDAGTTWEDETLRERLYNLKESSGIRNDLGEYGTFNIAFGTTDNVNIVNDTVIGKLPEFVLDPSIKIGDTIDSRDYRDEDVWPNSWGYQTSDFEYQRYSNFSNNYYHAKGLNIPPYGKTLIPDGAIITI
jgi:hypothetical protein